MRALNDAHRGMIPAAAAGSSDCLSVVIHSDDDGESPEDALGQVLSTELNQNSMPVGDTTEGMIHPVMDVDQTPNSEPLRLAGEAEIFGDYTRGNFQVASSTSYIQPISTQAVFQQDARSVTVNQNNCPELIQAALEAQSGRVAAQAEMEKMRAISNLEEQNLRTEAQATIYATQASAEAAVSQASHQQKLAEERTRDVQQ